MAFTDYDKCALLLPMDGSNGGTTFTDWSPTTKTVTANGNAQTSTTQFQYYDSSGKFDGSGDYLSVPNHADFSFGSGDFGVGMWVYPTSLSSSQDVIAHRNSADNNNFWLFRINITTGTIRFYALASSTVITDITSIGTLTLNSWTHIEYNRISGAGKIYVGGTNNDSVTTNLTSSYIAPSYPIIIGAGGEVASNPFNGYMQDLIIKKSAVLHSTDFTPPTRLIGEISGTVYDSTGTEAARTITAAPRSYPTKVYTTTSSGVDGTYSLRVPATEVTRVALADDVAEGATYNDIVDRIIPE